MSTHAPRKFRVWDGSEMHEPPHEFTLSGSGHLFYDADGISRPVDGVPLFYTGLTDAEGAEVYEGDVLGFPNEEESMVVIWDEGMQAFRGQFPSDQLSGNTWWLAKQFNDRAQATVIGNRYENPDLLKEPA